MNIHPLFREVRMVRQFDNQPIPHNIILEVLDDAVWAPNHRLREPWRFIYMEGESKEKLVAAVTSGRHIQLAETIAEAPAAMIVTVKTNKDNHIASDDFAAACCLIHNIQLLGWARGLGMHWDLADYSDCSELHSLAQIGADERIAGILALGFFDQNTLRNPSTRNMLENKIEVW